MAKTPEARYATCGEFVRALAQALVPGEVRTKSHSAIWIGTAAALVIGAVVAGLVLFGGDHKEPGILITPTTPPASPVFTGIVRIDPDTVQVATRIPTNLGIGPFEGVGSVRTLAAGSGAVWLLNPGTGTVDKINPTSGQIVGHIPLTLDISFGGGIVTSDGRLWVLSAIPDKLGAEVIAIDPTTDRPAAPVEMAGPARSATTVTAGEGKLWALASRTLYRIAPKTRDVSTTSFPGSLTDVAAGEGAVWVLDSLNSTLIEIDPVTLGIRDHVPLSGSPLHVVTGGGAVWVMNGEGTVSRIPVGTNGGIDTIPVGPDPYAIAVGANAVWVANRGGGTVTRIDLADSTTTTIKVGGTVGHIAVGEGAVWVTESNGARPA